MYKLIFGFSYFLTGDGFISIRCKHGLQSIKHIFFSPTFSFEHLKVDSPVIHSHALPSSVDNDSQFHSIIAFDAHFLILVFAFLSKNQCLSLYLLASASQFRNRTCELVVIKDQHFKFITNRCKETVAFNFDMFLVTNCDERVN